MRKVIHLASVLLPVVGSLILFGDPRTAQAQSDMKAVMQISSTTQQVVMRGLQNALEIADESLRQGVVLDLKVVICGPAADQFVKGMSSDVRIAYEKASERNTVHFFVCAPDFEENRKEPEGSSSWIYRCVFWPVRDLAP